MLLPLFERKQRGKKRKQRGKFFLLNPICSLQKSLYVGEDPRSVTDFSRSPEVRGADGRARRGGIEQPRAAGAQRQPKRNREV